MLVFSGGTGTPKLLAGLREILPSEKITVVVNTAEDVWISGNFVTPDIDTVIYLFADKLDTFKWWGIINDTFTTHEYLLSLNHKEIMQIGDKDRAIHIMRSDMIRSGYTLTEATLNIVTNLGIKSTILPMSDDIVQTMITTPQGKMHFQNFWLQHHGNLEVIDVVQEGIEEAVISSQVIKALKKEENILIGPSNPITSIGPIISLCNMKKILKNKKVIAVSPFIGKEPISGPAGKLMSAKGLETSSLGVLDYYKDIVDTFIVDIKDEYGINALQNSQCKILTADTLMNDLEKSVQLAKFVIESFEK